MNYYINDCFMLCDSTVLCYVTVPLYVMWQYLCMLCDRTFVCL